MENKFVTVQGVMRMCGDYCAWHEASIYCEWIFGDEYGYEGDLSESICESNDIEWEDYEKLSKSEKDVLATSTVEKYDGDYCDYDISSMVVEIQDGEILNKYMSV